MKRSLITLITATAFGTCFGIINFETVPTGYSLTDNEDLSGATFTDGNVEIQFTFSIGTPALEDANTGEFADGFGVETGGTDPLGFATKNDDSLADDPTRRSDYERDDYNGSTWLQTGTGPGLGNYFLRSDPSFQDFGTFTIDYVNGTFSNALSFQIWDIDGNTNGTEEYTITFQSGNAIDGYTDLHTITSLEADDADANTSLDGLPYLVSYDAGTDEITRVIIDFTGTKAQLPPSQQSMGLAFDNFSPESIIPEPASLATVFGLVALLYARRR